MEKITNKDRRVEYIGPDDPRWDGLVQEFVDWYIKQWTAPSEKGIPFYIEIDLESQTQESATIIGEENIKKYLENKD